MKKFLTLILCCAGWLPCFSQQHPAIPFNPASYFQNPTAPLPVPAYKPCVNAVAVDSVRLWTEVTPEQAGYFDNLISYARRFMGVPYRYAGYSAFGFDCSGFTSFVYAKFGQNLSRSAIVQAIQGKPVPAGQARKGDLVFFRGSNWQHPGVGHVGLVISNPGERLTFIHASCNRGISIENIDAVYYKHRFLKVCRIVQ